jgi:hypothetical protein
LLKRATFDGLVEQFVEKLREVGILVTELGGEETFPEI